MIKFLKQQSSFLKKQKWGFLFLKDTTIVLTLETAFRAFQKMLFGWNMYTTLYRFPLSRYIDYTVSEDVRFSRLVKWVYVPFWMHKQNEEKLTLEYIKISENNDLKFNRNLNDKINEQINKIRTFQIVLEYFKALDLLSTVGRNLDDSVGMEFCKKNRLRVKPFTRERAILVLDNEIKTAYISFEGLKKQYKNTKSSDKKITREDFSKWITVLNYNKLNVNYSMSVADYIQCINMYQKMCEEIKNHGK